MLRVAIGQRIVRHDHGAHGLQALHHLPRLSEPAEMRVAGGKPSQMKRAAAVLQSLNCFFETAAQGERGTDDPEDEPTPPRTRGLSR